ncbi:MAG: hypothetical protein AAFQ94_11380 [Bacteroidota bacterium]
MMAGSLAVPSIYLDFEIRKDYIAKVLCINKEKPITQCGGKCFLKRQLENTQQGDQQGNVAPRLTNINFYSPSKALKVEFNSLLPTHTKYVIPNTIGHSQLFHSDIFHPPC